MFLFVLPERHAALSLAEEIERKDEMKMMDENEMKMIGEEVENMMCREFYTELMSYLDRDVTGTMQAIAECEGVVNRETGKPEVAPEDILYFLKESMMFMTPVQGVCEKMHIRLPLKLTRVVTYVTKLYLTIHPEIIDDTCSNFVLVLPRHPTKEQQKRASGALRLCLEQIYHLKVAEESTLEKTELPSMAELKHAIEVLDRDELMEIAMRKHHGG